MLFFWCLLLLSLQANAEEAAAPRYAPHLSELAFEARGAYELVAPDLKFSTDESAVRGQSLFFRLQGELLPGLTYTYIHRLSKLGSGKFFDSIDHLHLDWRVNSWFGLSGGKEVVALGGIEYDYNPIDIYYTSAYYSVVPCYQWGVSLRFFPTQTDQIQLQLAQSMMRQWAGENTANVNLMWHGQHGPWKALWSVSGIQSVDKQWVGYLCIGNRFDILPQLRLDLDAMMRTGLGRETFTGKDWTFIGELSGRPVESLRIFGRMMYDFNLSGNEADLLLENGTTAARAGFGLEYSPVKKMPDILRLFAVGYYGWGQTLNDSGEAVPNREVRFQMGVRFRMDILDCIRYAQQKRALASQQQ